MTHTEKLASALEDLQRAYVNLLETGRDRIIASGGQCDPVDVMERSDPHLRAARESLADWRSQQGGEAPSFAEWFAREGWTHEIKAPMREAFEAGAEAERERIAQLCDTMALYTGVDCAAAIRKTDGG